jgi:hypothetical protein
LLACLITALFILENECGTPGLFCWQFMIPFPEPAFSINYAVWHVSMKSPSKCKSLYLDIYVSLMDNSINNGNDSRDVIWGAVVNE